MALLEIPTWDDNITLYLERRLHDLQTKAIYLLPNFNGEGNVFVLEHI
jgi:hypothetical protein